MTERENVGDDTRWFTVSRQPSEKAATVSLNVDDKLTANEAPLFPLASVLRARRNVENYPRDATLAIVVSTFARRGRRKFVPRNKGVVRRV